MIIKYKISWLWWKNQYTEAGSQQLIKDKGLAVLRGLEWVLKFLCLSCCSERSDHAEERGDPTQAASPHTQGLSHHHYAEGVPRLPQWVDHRRAIEWTPSLQGCSNAHAHCFWQMRWLFVHTLSESSSDTQRQTSDSCGCPRISPIIKLARLLPHMT